MTRQTERVSYRFAGKLQKRTDAPPLPHSSYRYPRQPQEIQGIFYYDSENSTLMPLDVGEVSLERNSTERTQDDKRAAGGSASKRNPIREDVSESSGKRQKTRDAADDDGTSTKTSGQTTQKDSFVVFGNFVAEELRNIKDRGQMQLARLRIHQILFDGACGLLKMPIPRL